MQNDILMPISMKSASIINCLRADYYEQVSTGWATFSS